jgi:hypothetical protein
LPAEMAILAVLSRSSPPYDSRKRKIVRRGMDDPFLPNRNPTVGFTLAMSGPRCQQPPSFDGVTGRKPSPLNKRDQQLSISRGLVRR